MPQPGEVWIANIPFTSGTASKLRPVRRVREARLRKSRRKSRKACEPALRQPGQSHGVRKGSRASRDGAAQLV